MGCQVREHTDELTHAAGHLSRDQWIDELNATCLRKIQRSFFRRSFSRSLLFSAGRNAWAGRPDPLDTMARAEMDQGDCSDHHVGGRSDRAHCR